MFLYISERGQKTKWTGPIRKYDFWRHDKQLNYYVVVHKKTGMKSRKYWQQVSYLSARSHVRPDAYMTEPMEHLHANDNA